MAGVKVTPTVGNSISLGGTTQVRRVFAFEANYARELKRLRLFTLQLELPFVATPTAKIASSNFLVASRYSSLYLTPSFRLMLTPGSGVTPWLSLGGGIVRYTPGNRNQFGGPSNLTSVLKGAIQGGAGIDFKAPFFPISFRAEAREFYSGSPLGLKGVNLRNNIMIGGGAVLRF
ncbi:MAG TPA: hypothetical protein VNW97_22290 [Candidatus Saccharimonadales bacterium]|nr:hypothetical protein [Candidatus Saccharimonadales bacterium]